MVLNAKPRNFDVEFRDMYFYAAPPMHDQRQLRLKVTLQRGTGRFEVKKHNIIAKFIKFSALNVEINSVLAILIDENSIFLNILRKCK